MKKMFGKSIVSAIFLMAVIFIATESSYAQGNLCVLGVGNCPQNGNNGNNNTGNGDNGGRKYLEGAAAADVLKYINYGSRYLLVLSRTYDPNTRCNIEIRAWVSAIEGQEGNRIALRHGPTQTVQVCNGSLQAYEINNLEAQIKAAHNAIYEWQKYQERLTPYLNDPRYNQEYQRAAAWVNWYSKFVDDNRAKIAKAMQ